MPSHHYHATANVPVHRAQPNNANNELLKQLLRRASFLGCIPVLNNGKKCASYPNCDGLH
jgi:hypothetical protein